MKSVCRRFMPAALALAAGASFTAAAALKVGDPAPKLQTGKFVQGEPVKEFLPGKAYLVEFWATWCVPCRVAIPHLNEMNTEFQDKGLIVIGQDCEEPDDSKVAPFVKSMGQKMAYRVALDDKADGGDGKMEQTWKQAVELPGIPVAFLIDTTGRIAWIGRPFYLKEKTIEDVLAGTFNAKEVAAAEEMEEERRHALGKELAADVQAKDWDDAMIRLNQLTKLEPASLSDMLNTTRLQILFGKKDAPAAFKLIREMGDAHKDDPMAENNLAWMIVSDKAIEHPDLALAEDLAQRAIAGFKEEAARFEAYDTLARIRFMQGKKVEAIALEQKVVALMDNAQKDNFQKELDSYKKGVLPEAN